LDYQVFESSRTFNTTTFETSNENYSIVLGANTSLTKVELFYDGIYYDLANASGTWYNAMGINSTMLGSNNFNFKFTYGAETFFSSNSTQQVNETIFTLCNSTYPTMALNISFKDEADESYINASIPTSTFTYYLGNATVNKSYTFINNTANYNYSFCISPNTSIFYVSPNLQYKNGTTYPQRIWEPAVQTYNGTNTNKTLYLLSFSDGLYVTFIVINEANQVLSGVEVTAERTIIINELIGTLTTGADGSATFWLNPDFTHTFNFSKTGYDDYTTSFAPTQSSYVVTLSGGTEVTYNDTFKGIKRSILPVADYLENDTAYNFKFNLTSSYWEIDSYGFQLRLSNGTTFDGGSSAIENTELTLNYNVTNQSVIFMDYYWVISGNYTNGTTYWIVTNTLHTGYSIKNFFTDFNDYLEDGMFGLDSFGLNLIVYIILFLTLGIMSYRYGITSPIALSLSLFGVVYFFDRVVNLVPSIMGMENFLTFVAALILILSLFLEVKR